MLKMTDAVSISSELRLLDIPPLILRRKPPFASVSHLPEWRFWFYVFEKLGREKALPFAVESARFFVQHYPALTPPPAAYTEFDRSYGNQWWRSIQPANRESVDAWDDIDVMKELEEATDYLSNDIVSRRRGKSELTLSMAGAGRNPPRIEFDVGTVPLVFGLNPYHPKPDRLFNQQTFFGFWGAGQIGFWSVREIKPKLKAIMEFYNLFLPIFYSAT